MLCRHPEIWFALTDAVSGASLVGVHHTRKMHTGDFVDRVSGTNAVAGAADFVVMLDRKRHRGIQLGCSSSVRAWSIWSLGVRRGRGHRLTLASDSLGLASEDAAAFSIFFSYGLRKLCYRC
jgi:hypothetical protein